MTEPIVRLAAALEGRYTLDHQIGEGGMATVYLAQDVRHHRKVALKVLRPELAAVVGAERFLGEIRTTANLQHPHILPLFDSGEAGGFLFYVMPFVEGETLLERLQRDRQLPVDEAVRIALGVANALQYAHEQGVIHRDIKPANILLSRGEPLVADFGIALAVSQAGSGRFTETGLSLGTPHYMSPEQAAGDRSVDARTDVYALGSVLYEMLAGEPPYVGSSPQAVLAKVLTEDPKRITEARRTVPAHVDAVVAKAIEKLPADRFASADAFGRALQDPAFRHDVARTAGHGAAAHGGKGVGAARLGGLRPLWAGVWAASLFVTALLAVWASGDAAPVAPPAPTARFAHVLPAGLVFNNAGRPLLAISPDGSKVAFVASGQIFLRHLGEVEARPIQGTQEPNGLSTPVFSPDGEWIAYITPPAAPDTLGAFKKIRVEGGSPVQLSSSGTPFGASWGEDGTILVGVVRGVRQIPEDGGPGDLIITVDSLERAFEPQLLPDGEHVLFTVANMAMGAERWERAAVVVQSIRTGARDTLANGTDGRWVPGHLLYVNDNTLLAVGFDERRREVIGGPVPVASELARAPVSNPLSTGSAHFDVSRNGVLAYGHADGSAVNPPGILAWVDRAGRVEPISELQPATYSFPRIEPRGGRILVRTDDDIWIYDLSRGGGALRLTRDGGNYPSWSPDGGRVAYTGNTRGLDGDAFVLPSDGSGQPLQLTDEVAGTHTDGWTPDGNDILVHLHAQTIDVATVPVSNGVQKSRLLLADRAYSEDSPVASPDGKWVAYTSNETGTRQLFITSFPTPGPRYPVSTNGAREPVWAKNGEIFFRTNDGLKMMAVRVTTSPSVRFGTPQELFDASFAPPPVASPLANYDVTADGQRFLMIARGTVNQPPPRPEIRIVMNWARELESTPR